VRRCKVNRDVYAEKLNWFKENERPEAVLRIADEPELIKIVIAWTNTATEIKPKLTRLRSDSEGDTWKWLWENSEFSQQDLIARAGVFEHGLDKKLAVLIGNRVLYPDGTVNSFVERYLREKVLRLFDVTTRKTKKATARSS